MKRVFQLSAQLIQTGISYLSFIFGSNTAQLSLSRDTKTIIFFGYHLQPRIARLISVINERYDFQICLFCEKGKIPKKYISDDLHSSIHIFEYKNKWEALTIISTLNIQNAIVHSFEPRCTTIAFIHRKKKHFNSPKFVFDIQDLYVNYFGLNPKEKWIRKDIKAEKYCIEQLDGLICHSLEINPASRAYKIETKKKLFFPLYCDERNCLPVKTTSPVLPWKIVYAGNITGKKSFKTKQIGQFHDLIETFNNQGIEFHIYPSPNVNRETLDEYEDLKSMHSNFFLHRSVNQELLSEELSKYHFGIIPFFLDDSSELPVKYKYATTLKLFNYFEAGIPVLVSQDLIFQSWITERHSLGIGVDKDFLAHFSERITKFNYKSLTESYEQNREKLLLQRHVHKILEFYQEL